MDQDPYITILNYISSRIPLQKNEEEYIRQAYQIKHLKRKEMLFEQGTPCEIEAFVISGSFRIFYMDQKGLEHVLYFAFPEWWVGDMASFYSGEDGRLNAQALEDSLVLVTTPDLKEKLFEQIPSFERLVRIIVQRNLSVVQKRLLLSYSASAAERYEELIHRSPGIEQLVPQHQIASYLGILPESLSRIKKQRLQKKS